MKKILIFLLLLFPIQTLAHPLDISSSFLSFNQNYLNITTYFHSYEIEYLLAKNNIHPKSVYEYYNYKDIIQKYINQTIKLKSNNTYCPLSSIEILDLEEYQILSRWLEINYHFKCDEDIKKGQIEIYFFDNFPLQTNQITVYNLNDSKVSKAPIWLSVLNSNLKIYTFDLSKNFKKCVIDSDWDWLSDEEESIYKTNPNKIDSDWDFYTDYEEIYWSFNPLDNNFWPNQEPRKEIPKYILENIKNQIKTQKDCDGLAQSHINIANNWLLTSWFTNDYFIKTLENIWKYVKNKSNDSLIYILLAVVFLGFIHAMWPGHSKSLLISYILDKNKNFFDWLVFITIFSITHLIDIVILFWVTKIFLNFYDISNYMLYIQRVSVIILSFFSLYLIYKSIKQKNEQYKSYNIKQTFLLWFISGLVPCTFGWSIFLLLFSLWSFQLILPMIFSLWIWIFLCLFFVMIMTFILRKKVFEKINLFSKYSSIFSSVVLFILSLYLITVIF